MILRLGVEKLLPHLDALFQEHSTAEPHKVLVNSARHSKRSRTRRNVRVPVVSHPVASSTPVQRDSGAPSAVRALRKHCRSEAFARREDVQQGVGGRVPQLTGSRLDVHRLYNTTVTGMEMFLLCISVSKLGDI